MKKLILLLAALLVAALACTCVSLAESTDVVDIQVLFTSDLHGALYDSQYGYGDAETISGTALSTVATLLKERRAMYDNNIVIDNGDTLQGTPFTYYYCFYDTETVNPIAAALQYLDFDIWVMGNHEFNYGMDILNKEVAELKSGDNPVDVLVANFVAEGSTDFTPAFGGAYKVFEFDGVKVGVIGMDTPNIPEWDKPENWAGIDFVTFVDTWNYYASILKDVEGCDIVVASCHSGCGATEGNLVNASDLDDYMNGTGVYFEDSYENQIGALIANTTGIDLVLGGHTHETSTYTVANADGVEVPVIHCGTKGKYLGTAVLSYDKAQGKLVNVALENLATKDVAPDADFLAAMNSYETKVWDEYLNTKIGTASASFESPANMTEANAFLDLVNKVQLEATGAQLSISAPLTNGTDTLIPEGDIYLGRMFQLYIYENWLYNIDMTGAEIKAWLEFAATHYTVDENGEIKGGGIYCDTLYGEGVSYEIYLGNEPGDQVRNIMFQGQPLDMEATYQVAINNYRFTGGGHYIENVPTMEPGDTSRVNYSTQYDMEQGEDLGQVRNLLTQYITDAGTISPDVTSEFHVYATASEN